MFGLRYQLDGGVNVLEKAFEFYIIIASIDRFIVLALYFMYNSSCWLEAYGVLKGRKNHMTDTPDRVVVFLLLEPMRGLPG